MAGLVFVADTRTCFSDANPSEAMHVGPLTTICQLGADFLTTIKYIRNALPLERLIKVNSFVADVANGLDQTMTKVAPTILGGE